MGVHFLFVGVITMATMAVSSTSGSSSSTSSRTFHHSLSKGVTLNPRRLQEMGGHGQWLLRHMAILSHTCGLTEAPSMRRKLLRKSKVTCNDGSPAGYYIRRSRGSKTWVVFLEGGWYCFDTLSCTERSRVMPDFMSSRNWPRYRSGSGILSWDPEENPYHFHSNIVYIPHCSSDSWSGTTNRTATLDFAFMGSLILDEVFNELWKKGLRHAHSMLLAGTSAGGTGVLINIDRIADFIHARAPQIEVRGLVDAGWFLDNEPFKPKHCRDSFTCAPKKGIQKGIQVWAPRLPKDCTSLYPDEIWRCYFGHRIYQTIKSPVYIVQNQYDAAQIKVSNVFDEQSQDDFTSEQWRYLLQLGEDVKATLNNATAVFAPACVSHEILTKPEWHTIRIQGTSLPESLSCWMNGGNSNFQCQHSNIDLMLSAKDDTLLADAPPTGSSKRKKRRKRKKKRKKNRRKKKNRRRNTKRNSRSLMKRCKLKLLDDCPWPHCNCSCPKCRWETINQVNQYFLRTLATVMGIDPSAMTNINLCGY